MRTILSSVILLFCVSCHDCWVNEIRPVEGDFRIESRELMRDNDPHAYYVSHIDTIIRKKPALVQGFEYLQDVDYSKYDVINLLCRGHDDMRDVKGTPTFLVTINPDYKQVNCYTQFKYIGCKPHGFYHHVLFISVQVPKLPDNYEVNVYCN